MKKLVLVVVAVIALAGASLFLLPVRAFLVSLTLPDYPGWPDPPTSLGTGDAGEIYFATSSPYDLEVILTDMSLARPTTGRGYLTLPEDADPATPVPAMILLHGSGGIAPGREHEYAQWFNSMGVAAFVIDYYAPRGFGPDSDYFVRNSAVTEFDLITDAYAALRLLGTSPLIDGERIGVMGFSYGGMATRLAMDARIRAALAPGVPPFALHIDAYGPCFQNLQSPEVTGGPLLSLRGTEDASVDLEACAQREEELRQLGTKVTARIYEGVGHAWENTEPRHLSEESPYLRGCEVIYDDRGRALLNGEPLANYPLDAPLATRMAARFSSGARFRDCLGHGYIVGRDEQARAQGYADIEAFLRSTWP